MWKQRFLTKVKKKGTVIFFLTEKKLSWKVKLLACPKSPKKREWDLKLMEPPRTLTWNGCQNIQQQISRNSYIQVGTEFKFLFIKEKVEYINYVFGVLLFISYLIKVAALHKTWANDTFFTIYVTYFYLQTFFGQIFVTWISKHYFELIWIDICFIWFLLPN